MPFKATTVRSLLEAATSHYDLDLSYSGLIKLSTKIPETVKEDYLYKLYLKVRDADDADEKKYRFSEFILNNVAKDIGKISLAAFEREIKKTLDQDIENYYGTWWSIVRANAGDSILKAPVKIYRDGATGKACIVLRGGNSVLNGNAALLSGNLFCELSSKTKKLSLVMKAGTLEYPKMLQGVFSGISSAGDPIAGREIFLRENKEEFEKMEWKKIPVAETVIDKRINKYFSKKEANCIKIKDVSTYSLTDLDA